MSHRLIIPCMVTLTGSAVKSHHRQVFGLMIFLNLPIILKQLRKNNIQTELSVTCEHGIKYGSMRTKCLHCRYNLTPSGNNNKTLVPRSLFWTLTDATNYWKYISNFPLI